MPRQYANPFRPGAGHTPPFLAGRTKELLEMKKYLEQQVVTQNIIVTGLRGVGKTVFLDAFKPIALESGWQWTNADMSEITSLSEDNIAKRILLDISLITSKYEFNISKDKIGFINNKEFEYTCMNFNFLSYIYDNTPGLISDKLKYTLEYAWNFLKTREKIHGIVFSYDEAQNLSDNKKENKFPLSLLLDVFQSIQRKNIPFLLILTGLPIVFSKLVESRTYAERMFHTIQLSHLNYEASREAIAKPLEADNCPIKFNDKCIDLIITNSDGYPYFIQYICKEVYDFLSTDTESIQYTTDIPINDILQKLDNDFFIGRWQLCTDRQKELLQVISTLDNCKETFTVQEISKKSKEILKKGFTPSHINQMLLTLTNSGMVYKNRFGKYSLAVPLLSDFIKRQL